MDGIDTRVAAALGVAPADITSTAWRCIPITREVYLSVSRLAGGAILPAVVKVAADGTLANVDLAAAPEVHVIADPPSSSETFRDRSHDWPVPGPVKYDAKARTPTRSMTIVDMKFHDQQLFIAGISNQAFSSTLRRVTYPFGAASAESQIRIYHVAHSRYADSRADPGDEFRNDRRQRHVDRGLYLQPAGPDPRGRIEGRRQGDRPDDRRHGERPTALDGLVRIPEHARTVCHQHGHSPRIIPISGLQGAKVYTENPPKPYAFDMSPEYPLGPVGKGVMFVGALLRADLLNSKYFVSLTRDAASGALNLESLPTAPLPMRLDTIWSEFDFQGGGPVASR